MKKFLKYFEMFYFIYFLVGVVCGILVYFGMDFEFLEFLFGFYSYTFFLPISSIIYIIFGCLLCKHRNYLINIVDGVLCFILTVFYPSFTCYYIYGFNKYLYYFMGLCFSFFPLIFCIIEKNKIEFFHIVKTVTRIFMIIFAVLVILIVKSCGA